MKKRWIRRPFGRALLGVLLCALPTQGLAQHEEINFFSTQDGSGKLTAVDFDQSTPIQVFEALCSGGLCLYTSSAPGVVVPNEDRPAQSLFGLHGPRPVSLEIVSNDAAASVRFGTTVLDQPGESVNLGNGPDLHAHGEWRVIVSQGTYGQFSIRFKVKASGYTDSDPVQILLSNATPSPTPTATPTPPPTSTPTATPTPTPTPTAPPTASPPPPTPTQTATATPVPVAELQPYLLYRASAPKLPAPPDNHQFPKGWNVQLDDVGFANTPPEAFPDDPENYTVKGSNGVAEAAEQNAEPASDPSLSYLRYSLGESKEGAGAVLANGKFPKAVKAPPRRWEVTNSFGSLVLETDSVRSLWLPAGTSETPTAPAAADATHYLCYQAAAAKEPSDQAPDPEGDGKGTFRKDLQAFVRDAFDDCALLADGVNVPFAGTPVAGTCLVDVKAPRELCRPVAKTAVEPPRTSAADIDGSIPLVSDESLLCYQVKLAKKARGPESALGGVAPGDKIAQAKHVKHEQKDGTALATAPGNRFPRPVAVDTKLLEQLCIPTVVESASLR